MASKKKKSVKKSSVKKRKCFLKEQYVQSWDFIKESKNFILFSFGIFVIAALGGLFFPVPESIALQIQKFIEELLLKTEGLSTIGMIWFIFKNNFVAALIGIFAGIFLGIYPFLSSVINGYVVGVVSKLVVLQEGVFQLWRLLPHGIFELPAIFISFGLGIRFGTFFFFTEGESFIRIFLGCLRVFVFVLIPLLVVAAIIEGWLMSFLI